jgi:LmbE family N-acetylglucosaminyl deacetylase
VSRTIAGRGTPEAAWRAWPGLRRLPSLALAPAPDRVVVVAPHPDDEVLGAGGLVALLERRGTRVVVLALTDGEASHGGADAVRGLAVRRAAETDEALRRLLARRPEIRRLGLPDGGLAQHVETLAAGIADALAPGSWCLAPHRLDGHPDHEAAAHAARDACRERGARLLEYPIWLWHWSRPGAAGALAGARRVDLPAAVAARKRRAIAAFASQLRCDERADGAVLPAHVLARFERPFEVVVA